MRRSAFVISDGSDGWIVGVCPLCEGTYSIANTQWYTDISRGIISNLSLSVGEDGTASYEERVRGH